MRFRLMGIASKRRRVEQEKLSCLEFVIMQFVLGAVAAANRQVKLTVSKVHGAALGVDAYTDVGIAIGEPTQPRD